MSGASIAMAMADAVAMVAAPVGTTAAVTTSAALGATTQGPDQTPTALALADTLADTGGGNGPHRGKAAAAAAAIAAGVAIAVLLTGLVLRRVRRSRAAHAAPKRASLREAFTRGYRCGDVVAVEPVGRKRSSVSYGFGTFDQPGDGMLVSDALDEEDTLQTDPYSDQEDTLYQRPSRPSMDTRRSSSAAPRLGMLSTSSGNDPELVESVLTIPLLGPTAGVVLAQPGRRGPIVVEKVVPGGSCYHADPPHRITVGDVLRGVQTIRIGRYHDLDGVRSMVISQVKLAYRTGRPLRLVVARPEPDPYA